jgi:hypothetical protein
MPLFNTVNILEMAGQEYGSMFGSEKASKSLSICPTMPKMQSYATLQRVMVVGKTEMNT